MCKVLIFGVDGVLTHCNYSNTKTFNVDPEKVKFLRAIVKQSGAKLVLISSWAEDLTKDKKPKCLQVLEQCLAKEGLKLHDIIRYKPTEFYEDDANNTVTAFSSGDLSDLDIKLGTGKAPAVVQWLYEHPVESYVIVDDEDYDWSKYGLYNKWIKTEYYGDDSSGLTLRDAAQVCIKLQKQFTPPFRLENMLVKSNADNIDLCYDVLLSAVENECSFMISGGNGTGKETLGLAILDRFPINKSIVTNTPDYFSITARVNSDRSVVANRCIFKDSVVFASDSSSEEFPALMFESIMNEVPFIATGDGSGHFSWLHQLAEQLAKHDSSVKVDTIIRQMLRTPVVIVQLRRGSSGFRGIEQIWKLSLIGSKVKAENLVNYYLQDNEYRREEFTTFIE